MTKEEESIREAVEKDGKYSHNVISCALRCVANQHGDKEANRLIDKYDLTELYGIEKVKI